MSDSDLRSGMSDSDLRLGMSDSDLRSGTSDSASDTSDSGSWVSEDRCGCSTQGGGPCECCACCDFCNCKRYMLEECEICERDVCTAVDCGRTADVCRNCGAAGGYTYTSECLDPECEHYRCLRRSLLSFDPDPQYYPCTCERPEPVDACEECVADLEDANVHRMIAFRDHLRKVRDNRRSFTWTRTYPGKEEHDQRVRAAHEALFRHGVCEEVRVEKTSSHKLYREFIDNYVKRSTAESMALTVARRKFTAKYKYTGRNGRASVASRIQSYAHRAA
jgi:hypothetical protein